MKTLLALLLLPALTLAAENEIGFVEKFALAPERAAVLDQLIPGTEDYYYYHALHEQNLGRYDEVEKILAQWVKRHNRTPRVLEIENRQALLRYGQQAGKSLDFIKDRLGLQFDHQRQIPGQKPSLPTQLDQQLISRKTLLDHALGRSSTLDQLEESAFGWLLAENIDLDTARRRDLLSRLDRPDHPGLVKLILADLDTRESGGFGEFDIHRQLLQTQLDELVKARPSLHNDSNFIQAYLAKLAPNEDVDLQHNKAAREAYLERAWNFVADLPPAHNSLKASILRQRLEHDRQQGVYDKQRFLTYLQIPRAVSYIQPVFLKEGFRRNEVANLQQSFDAVRTIWPPVPTDTLLVSDYFEHFFQTEEDWQPYVKWVAKEYLQRVFAETKILAGKGDIERWASMLSPQEFQSLKERVDIEFAPTNPEQTAPGDELKLRVRLKNTGPLLVKVYEINTLSFYLAQGREIGTDLDLDGLVANVEKTIPLDQPPLRRVEGEIDLPELTGQRGVWVVEIIGNGRSSRALIRKGGLQALSRTSVAGEVFTVLDEKNAVVKEASLWMQGHEYRADEDGEIVVPFSTNPGSQQVVLYDGKIASLESFEHSAENYALEAHFYIDREQLQPRAKAKLLVRPILRINAEPADGKVLEEVKLTITSTDLDGVTTTEEIPGFELHNKKESVHEMQIPDRLASLHFRLSAKVESLTKGEKIDLAAESGLSVNAIDMTVQTDDVFLSKKGDDWVAEVLGKNGEPRQDRAVAFQLKHRDFKEPAHVSLKTDDAGRIQLGALEGIVTVTANPTGSRPNTWALERDEHTSPLAISAIAGGVIRVPYMGAAEQTQRAELSLLEVRGGVFVRDLFESMKIANGFVEISGLEPGDYSLAIRDRGEPITIRVTEGDVTQGFVTGDTRHLEIENAAPLQIVSITPGADGASIRLANANEFTRVHVVATRFVPAFDPFSLLDPDGVTNPEVVTRAQLENNYLSGRDIGDEYRYILDRKTAPKFPGNMLTRPGLLLNPWKLRETETDKEVAQAGEEWDKAMPGAMSGRSGGGRARQQVAWGIADDPAGLSDFSDIDFLATDSVTLYNLTPGKDGVVHVKAADLGDRHHLHVVAIDPENTVYRQVALPEFNAKFEDIRLAQSLDPKRNFTEQKQVTIVPEGGEVTLTDLRTASFEAYDDTAKVYQLLLTLSSDATLAEFKFILDWPKLKPEEKREKYSKYASHELNFWLSRKDPEFFETVVQPYLRNKKDKTFMDHYLIGDDLTGYLEPWQYARLNIPERILLSRRIDGEREKTARHVRELFELLPPGKDDFDRLFETALQGRALSADAGGLSAAAGQTRSELREADARRAPLAHATPAPAAPATALAAAEPMMDQAMAAQDFALEAMADAPADGLVMEGKVEMAKEMPERMAQAQDEMRQGYLGGKDKALRQKVRRLYRQMDPTKEWAENNYYHVPIAEQNGDLITVNAFWNDYAQWDGKGAFLSKNIAYAHRNLSEMMLALAVLDLPATAGEHQSKARETVFTIHAASPIILFHKEVKAAGNAEEKTPILVSESFFRQTDRYRHEGGEKIDKFVNEEFLAGAVYGAQVVVTNPTSTLQKLDLLVQAPAGSLPVLGSKLTKSLRLRLEPYSTQKLEYWFYFPKPGEFAHYPAHVSKEEKVVAQGEAMTFQVVDELSKVDTGSWEWISQNGDPAQVLDYLREHNAERTDLSRIAWRMKNADFFRQVIALLHERHVYSDVLWSYGIYHGETPVARQYLLHAEEFVKNSGDWLQSELLAIDPVARRFYQFLEYAPLVNARTHALGKERTILNDALLAQYRSLMKILTYKPTLDDEDEMSVTYYLLLQDRVAEAMKFFAKVDAGKLATRLQYDYFTAYINFYLAETGAAREVASKYADYPVDRWQKLFALVLAQLDEIDGKSGAVIDREDRDQQEGQLARTEPTLTFEIKNEKVIVKSQNLKEARVNYYLMDLEFLFSTSPFVTSDTSRFSIIQPNQTASVELEEDGTTEIPLPEEFRRSNVLIEIVAGGQRKAEAHYANTLDAQVVENYGRIEVTASDTGKPLPGVYVKVYARTAADEVKFYKDGYTDLRGKFDYTSLNTGEMDDVERFAILILSEKNGAVVREAAPPKR